MNGFDNAHLERGRHVNYYESNPTLDRWSTACSTATTTTEAGATDGPDESSGRDTTETAASTGRDTMEMAGSSGEPSSGATVESTVSDATDGTASDSTDGFGSVAAVVAPVALTGVRLGSDNP